MLSDIIAIGDKIDIKPLGKDTHPLHNARTFASQLLDFAEADVIHISAPIVYGRAVILPIGSYFNMCMYTNKGLYQCNCMVLRNQKENNTIVSVVRITTSLEKFQRRQYYRFECILDMTYRVITKEEELIERIFQANEFENDQEREECKQMLVQFDKRWVPALVVDISGGGARYNSSVQHNKEDIVRIKMEFALSTEVKKLTLKAHIIASTKSLNRSDAYEQRVEFIEISPKDREVLIRYIFEQERKLRNNKKI